MLWWQWVMLGIVLLGAEMMVDAEFYLVFLGVSAVSVGLLGIAWTDSPIWVQWVLFSLISIASLVLFRSKLYTKLRGNVPDYEESLIGEIGIVEADIAVGAEGRIVLRGTTWTARNVGDEALPREARVRVHATSGVAVEVRSAEA
jgi:membrane protein implicated in regulation of membrane protease activity